MIVQRSFRESPLCNAFLVFFFLFLFLLLYYQSLLISIHVLPTFSAPPISRFLYIDSLNIKLQGRVFPHI